MMGKNFDVPIHFGEWQGKVDFLAVTLDDFKLILRMDFLKTIKAAIVPHLGGLPIMDKKHLCL